MTQVWVENEFVGELNLACSPDAVLVIDTGSRQLTLGLSPRHAACRISHAEITFDASCVQKSMDHAVAKLNVSADASWESKHDRTSKDHVYTATWHVFQMAIETYHDIFDLDAFEPV